MSNNTQSLTRPAGRLRIDPVALLPRFLSRIRYRSTMITYISQNAFWGLLISAVEVYKRECFGLLIGYRDRKGGGFGGRHASPGSVSEAPDSLRRRADDEMYIVEHALPYQTARRRHRGVTSNPRPHHRLHHDRGRRASPLPDPLPLRDRLRRQPPPRDQVGRSRKFPASRPPASVRG